MGLNEFNKYNQIAVLITCHNRKEITLKCLKSLFLQKGIDVNYTLEVFILDDGCSDGTAEAVTKLFPTINIIKGNGNLFWNRGMHRAWQVAGKTKDYDFYLWLNNDTIIKPNALTIILNTSEQMQHQAIVVGTTSAVYDAMLITYGGWSSIGQLIQPTNEPQICSYFNGNIVLFPKYVYKIVGMNDPFFCHALGDFDYGKRADKLGIKSYIAPTILGVCDLHENLPTWCNPEKSFVKRWKAFRTPLGQNPEEFFVFEKRHKGLGKALLHYATNHLRVLCPKLWKTKTF